MTNNDVLRRLRYIFDLNDKKVMGIFLHGGIEATRTQMSAWLKKDDDEQFVSLADRELASFLNGFIVEKRGKRDTPPPPPEDVLTNNAILFKLKIALALRAEDMHATLEKGGLSLNKPELTAFFRAPSHRQYRPAKDQVLRTFLKGLQAQHRP